MADSNIIILVWKRFAEGSGTLNSSSHIFVRVYSHVNACVYTAVCVWGVPLCACEIVPPQSCDSVCAQSCEHVIRCARVFDYACACVFFFVEPSLTYIFRGWPDVEQ